jgi:hypothetical protein
VELVALVSSSLVATVVAGVPVVAATVLVVVAVFVAAAMQPVSTSMLVMLTAPAILRARRAGCGRGRRGVGGRAVGMTAPSGRTWDQHRRGR